jgi:transposase
MEKTILNTLFVGIDVDSQTNAVFMMNFLQKEFNRFRVKNDFNGVEILKDKTVEILKQENIEYVDFVLESTSVYAFHTATYLSSNEELLAYNPRVYCINPKISCNYRASFADKDKDDFNDAINLADLARVGRCDKLTPWRGVQLLALQRLTRHRKHLATILANEKNYILNNIYLKFSGILTASKGESPFSNLYGTTSSFILTDFVSPEDIISISIEDLIIILNEKGHKHFADPEKTAILLKQAASNSYKLDKVTLEPINLAITSSINCIRTYEAEIKSIDKSIAQQIKGLNDTEYTSLTSIKGIGQVLAAGIIAEIGSIDQFDNDNALAKFAGITWRKTQSGKFEAEDTPLTKTGNTYLRYYIIEAANQVKKYLPEYFEFYQKKYYEVNNHREARASVLTARKLIKLIFALMKSRSLYKER